MFTRIFVPLDGSTRAERALPIAARLARASCGTVVLARVAGDARELTPFFVQPPTGSPDVQDLEAAHDYLAQVARAAVLAGINPEPVVLTGRAAQSLLEAIDAQKADLAVVTSHGRAALVRWVLGSVAQRLVRHAKATVLVLREHGPALADARPDPEHRPRILVPLDGSAHAEAALAPAVALITALAAPRPGAVHLALVLPLYADEIDARTMPASLMLEGVTRYLERKADRLRAEQPGLIVSWSVSGDPDIATALIKGAQFGEFGELAWSGGAFWRCDLVAMATHGTGGGALRALGSVTERVLHATKLLVLVVRPREFATA
jgi:nucleotide-binding universal stress UspA family protein